MIDVEGLRREGPVSRDKTGFSLVELQQREQRLWYLPSRLPAASGIQCFIANGSSCRSIMLRLEDLAFFKALSTLRLSPAVVRELRMTFVPKKEEASGARRDLRHHIWRWGQNTPTNNRSARGQA
jgi:hypothetical protein